jgi:cysteine-rich CPXCG protein
MTEFLTLCCPYCEEEFQVPFEPTDGSSQFIVDCEICCQPMTVKVRVKGTELETVELLAA